MIRPFRHEVLRYGDYSRLEESIYDHPFQWGSKRTGLDLARVGGKYDNLWHYLHLSDPAVSTSPASNMPMYDALQDRHGGPGGGGVAHAGHAQAGRALHRRGHPARGAAPGQPGSS